MNNVKLLAEIKALRAEQRPNSITAERLGGILEDVVSGGSSSSGGEPGKSAYQAAIEGGYIGTEQEFNRELAKVRNKVDAVAGKGLSTNDFTNEDKRKLSVLSEQPSGSSICIHFSEQRVGSFVWRDKRYDLFEKTIQIPSSLLSLSADGITEVLIDENPLGRDLYLQVGALVICGEGAFVSDNWYCEKVYVDAQQKTIARLVCRKEFSGVISNALLSVRYLKGIVSFDTLRVEIPLSDIDNPEGVSVSIPTCKYNKQFVLSFVGDDSLMGIYQRAFNYIHGRWVDDKDILHDTEGRTTGTLPTRRLVYTDGAGNDVPFRLGVNWMAGKEGQNIHADGNTHLPYLWWCEGIRFSDYSNAILNHGGGNQEKPLESIVGNQKEIVQNVGVLPYLLGVPGGTTGYPEAAAEMEDVYALVSSQFEKYIKLSSIVGDVRKKRFGRTCIDTFSKDQIVDILTQYAQDSRWINLFCHNIKNGDAVVNGQLNADVCFAFLDYVYDTFGKGGDDRVWFASDSEVFEYLFIRNQSVISQEVIGDKLVVSIRAASMFGFLYKELSLLFTGVKTLENAVLSNNIVLHSHAKGLLNVCYSQRNVELAEKYTRLYETSSSADRKEEALLFVNRLRADLREPYMARLEGNLPQPTTYTVSGQSNNGLYGTVSPAVQVVESGGTANLTATAEAGYVIESWSGVSSNTGVGTSSGTAQVANVRADRVVQCLFRHSEIVSGSRKAILFASDKNGEITLSNGEKANRVRASFATATSDAEFLDTKGIIMGKKIVKAADMPAGVVDMNISAAANPVLSGNSGVYPDENITSLYGVYINGSYPSSRGVVRLKELSSSSYRVKILFSTSKVLTTDQVDGLVFEANGVRAQIPAGYNPTNNNASFVQMNSVVVGSDGILDIFMGNTQTWVRSGWNVIEIEQE